MHSGSNPNLDGSSHPYSSGAVPSGMSSYTHAQSRSNMPMHPPNSPHMSQGYETAGTQSPQGTPYQGSVQPYHQPSPSTRPYTQLQSPHPQNEPTNSQMHTVSPHPTMGDGGNSNSYYYPVPMDPTGQTASANASSPQHPVHGNMSDVPPEVTLTDYGTRLKLSGNLDDAMNKYVEATHVNSSYAPAYYNIGVIYSELGQYQDALNGYQAALQRNPRYVEAFCNIGVIYKNLGNLETAVLYYEKALGINPNFKIVRNNMAIALTDLGTKVKNDGDISKSIEHYKKALVYNAFYPDAYYNLGVAYGEQGMIDKAIVCYELGIHFNPFCCEAYNNLGVIFKDKGNLERALECYQSALQINPKFTQTLNNLDVLRALQGKSNSNPKEEESHRM